MSTQNKPKLSIKKQIDFFKQKGIEFNVMDERQAYSFLQNNSYLFKIKAYCNTYKIKDENNKTLKYKNLDFAYLVDLSIIDMHFRRFIIRLTLDLEHLIKTKLIRDFNSSSENGYDIVINFLNSNRHANDFLNRAINDTNILKQRGGDLYSIVQFLLDKYGHDLAIWNYLEIIQFGDLIELAKFFYKRNKNIEFDAIKDTLFNAKFLRNADAHNNCMLADLKDNICTPQKQIVDEIYRKKIFKRRTRKYIENNMKNRVLNDFITTIFIYDKICKSKQMKQYCFKELLELISTRFIRNKSYYIKASTIRKRYMFILRVITYFEKISKI